MTCSAYSTGGGLAFISLCACACACVDPHRGHETPLHATPVVGGGAFPFHDKLHGSPTLERDGMRDEPGAD